MLPNLKDSLIQLSFTSLWSHFGANVADLSSDWRMLVTPRIRQSIARLRSPPRDFTPHPAQRFLSYPAPPHGGRITISRGIGRTWARSDGFAAVLRNGARLRSGSS